MARHALIVLAVRAELKMTNGSHRTTTPHSSSTVSARRYRICDAFDCWAITNAPTSNNNSKEFHVGGGESSRTS